MTEVLDHWIAGATDPGEGTRTGPVYDPAMGVVSKEVRYGSAADVDRALRSVICEHGRKNEGAAGEYIKALAISGRYSRDVY